MRRDEGLPRSIDDLSGKQARTCRAGTAAMALEIAGQHRLHAVPDVTIDDRVVQPGIDHIVVVNLANIGRTAQYLVDLATRERHAADRASGLRNCSDW